MNGLESLETGNKLGGQPRGRGKGEGGRGKAPPGSPNQLDQGQVHVAGGMKDHWASITAGQCNQESR